MSLDTVGGDTPLVEILARTELTVRPGEFVLIGLEPDQRPRLEADLAHISGNFFQYLVEPDVLTLLLNTRDWSQLSAHYPAAKVEGPLRIFTFSIAMEWDVVGFLAAVTGVLARAGIPLGAVCGYYRDHLFISVDQAHRAETILRTEMERQRG
ncbi:MAG: ACT domain-containing protein [Anaerolineae bacterium]|nr:ACT domain-containing protein [Anaerolineae bacterium]